MRGDLVFPDKEVEGSDSFFPDGQPFTPTSHGGHGKFVYVWQTWGECLLLEQLWMGQ